MPRIDQDRGDNAPKQPTERLKDEPNLMVAILKDLNAIGLVGEDNNGLLTYVAMSSRKLNDPMSVIGRGKTSSGKSYLFDRCAQLMPESEVVSWTTATAASVFRLGEEGLRHKIVIGGERRRVQDDASADATAHIRQMLSEKKITKNVVGEDKRVQTLRVNGPIAYFETTTVDNVFDEDLNRMIQVWTNETDIQTKRIMMKLASRYSPDAKMLDIAEIQRRHWGFQDELEIVDVRIPYAEALAKLLPPTRTEMRRAITQVLATIESIVYLNQFSRTVGGGGYLLATYDDYEIARKLLMKPMHHVIGVGKDFDRVKMLFDKLPKEFDTKLAESKHEAGNRMETNRMIRRMIQYEIVKCVKKGSSHRPARYQKIAQSIEDLVLPSVERLRNFVTMKENRGRTKETPEITALNTLRNETMSESTHPESEG